MIKFTPLELKRCGTNRDMHGLEQNIEHQMWTWQTTVTVRVISLPEFKIPAPEEEPTMSASTCLKAEKTSMICLFIGLIFPEAYVCWVYFWNILIILAYWKYIQQQCLTIITIFNFNNFNFMADNSGRFRISLSVHGPHPPLHLPMNWF